MKRTFEIRSERLGCDIRFTYTSNGSLCAFAIMDDTDRPPEVIVDALKVAITLNDLQDVCKKYKIKLIEIQQDLTFATFWNAFNYKEGSKKKAEAIWNKLPDGARAKAIMYIKAYDYYLHQRGTAKALATTYLNGEYWEK